MARPSRARLYHGRVDACAGRIFTPPLLGGMRSFFTPRQRRLMGLPEQEEPVSTARPVPPRCCDKALPEHCTCEARGWRCPTHGYTGEECRPGRTHD